MASTIHEEDQRLLSLRQSTEARKNKCGICLDQISKKIFLLEGCNHLFCEICMRKYFRTKVEDGRFPICCPEPSCGKEASENDLKRLLPKKVL